MMRLLRSSAFWLRLVLGGFVVLNVLLLARWIQLEGRALRSSRGPDSVSGVDQAFIRVLPLLPQHGTVGYLKPDYERANAAHLAAFFRTQYALAPRVLVIGTQPDVVIAVAHDRGELPDVPDGFAMETAFDGKLALYRRVR